LLRWRGHETRRQKKVGMKKKEWKWKREDKLKRGSISASKVTPTPEDIYLEVIPCRFVY